ncbi:MAG: manganese efflux pump MntP family protein [Lachnospiraceae bacterium]|nr:manganese efflux pump MntP family protein [Lachnospiraceae bacterium]
MKILSFLSISVFLGFGLAMDAFSVSIANGFAHPRLDRLQKIRIAGCFAFFQFLMPMVGWFCVHTVAEHFTVFQKFIPWIALGLLGYIGGKMILEALRGDPEKKDSPEERCEQAECCGKCTYRIGTATLLTQGVATSIDALSVGFTISEYEALQAFGSSLIIAAVTYVLCALGLRFGIRFGRHLSNRATLAGGCVLILIGLEIFVKGVVFG